MTKRLSSEESAFLDAIALMLSRSEPQVNRRLSLDDVNSEDQTGWTPLFIAVAENKLDIAQHRSVKQQVV